MKNIFNIIVLAGVIMSMAAGADEQDFDDICANEDDKVKCATNFFSRHARCNVVRGATDKPVIREKHTAYMAKINLTIVTTNTRLTKLDGVIEKFYINKKTNNLVMTVNFTGIMLESPATYFFINQRGFEPKMLVEAANGTYPAILTAVIPAKRRITKETLKKLIVMPYLPQGNVNFNIGPKVTESTDPDVMAVVAGLAADVPTAVKEIFITESTNYFLAYLQKYICNFGIPLSSDTGYALLV